MMLSLTKIGCFLLYRYQPVFQKLDYNGIPLLSYNCVNKRLISKHNLFIKILSDNILVFKNNPLCRAKLFDFTSSIEVNDSMDFSSKILEEFNRFGLVTNLFYFNSVQNIY